MRCTTAGRLRSMRRPAWKNICQATTAAIAPAITTPAMNGNTRDLIDAIVKDPRVLLKTHQNPTLELWNPGTLEPYSLYVRIARSWIDLSACQPAEIAPSCQSGSECGVLAAEPSTMRLSTVESNLRRSAPRPLA